MKKLKVSIEIQGKQIWLGEISGERSEDATFSYLDSYLDLDLARPISLSLPLKEEPFSPNATKTFFDGLLPEGFTRRSIAMSLGVKEDDYLSLLLALGNECIGAIRIFDDESQQQEARYKKIRGTKIAELAREGIAENADLIAESRLSLAGATGKIGLYYEEKKDAWYLPSGDAPSTHIIKQSHIRLRDIVTNEQLVLKTAKRLGIDVPDSFIVNIGGGKDGDVLFASKRYDRTELSDRVVGGHICPLRRHQEDMGQALGIPPSSKYEAKGESYLKKIGELLRQVSKNPAADISKLWDITVFNYLVGNTDNHIKNLSIIYSSNLDAISLAPAYDLLSTVIYDGTTRNMAFNIGGVYSIDEIDRTAWERAALDVGLGKKYALERYDWLKGSMGKALSESTKELMDQGLTSAKATERKIRARGGIGR